MGIGSFFPCPLRYGQSYPYGEVREIKMDRLKNFIDGEFVEPKDGGYADLIDPTTGEAFASAPVSGEADVDAAMSAAAAAFESWRDTTPSERQRALLKLA